MLLPSRLSTISQTKRGRSEEAFEKIVFCVVCSVSLFVFRDRVSLYTPGCPGTHSVDQAGLELRNLPASASWVLGLKECATTPGFNYFYFYFILLYFILFTYFLQSNWFPPPPAQDISIPLGLRSLERLGTSSPAEASPGSLLLSMCQGTSLYMLSVYACIRSVSERSQDSGLVETAGFPTGWPSSSASSCLSLIQPQGSPNSVRWLGISICVCLSLVGPLYARLLSVSTP
jgi:hypothetical protein